MKLDYKRMLREVDVKQAQVESDQANFDRFAGLVKSGGVTRAEYDNARFLLMADKQAVEALKVAAAVQLARLGGDPEVDVRTMSDYLQAQARVDEAQRQLDHTVIYAPFGGIVTQVETVQPGMYLAAATAAFGLVSTDNVWVEANPKETELTHVKPGDPVDVTVDTYPGRTWKAEVESRSRRTAGRSSRCCRRRTPPATGSRWCSAFRCASRSSTRTAIPNCAPA